MPENDQFILTDDIRQKTRLPQAQSWYEHDKSIDEKAQESESSIHQTTHYELHTFYKPLSQCIKITPTTNPHKLIP